MHYDMFGSPLTVSDTSALQSWNATQLGFLAHDAATPAHLADTLKAAPDFALAHAVKGLMFLLLGRRELVATAHEAALAARLAAQQTPIQPHESDVLDALAAWLDGHPSKAVAHLETALERVPQNPLVMKLSHAIRFVLGDAAGMRRSIERVLPQYGDDHAARGYLLGCHAFALEETGDYDAARATGRRALDLAPDDAWGLHAVAHVYDMTADSQGGLTWLEGKETAWAHCNNFRYHVWWHKALMQLDLGQIDAVMALYDHEIRKDKTDDYRDIANATSLLSRLELEGVDVGHRWEELADLCETRTQDGCMIFADLHYLLALIGDDRDDAIAKLMQRLQHDACDLNDESHQRMAHPGLATAKGLEAFGEGDYQRAFSNLSRARTSMQGAGGSHAQRDVFERLTIDAGLRAGRLNEAGAILDQRSAQRRGTVDTYAAARYALIARGRAPSTAGVKLPAE